MTLPESVLMASIYRSEQFRRQYNVNVFGVLDVTTAVLPHMRARRTGTVVLLGSRTSWRSEVNVSASGRDSVRRLNHIPPQMGGQCAWRRRGYANGIAC